MKKTVKAWILTDGNEYFNISLNKHPKGFSNKYKSIPCTITYTIPEGKEKE